MVAVSPKNSPGQNVKPFAPLQTALDVTHCGKKISTFQSSTISCQEIQVSGRKGTLRNRLPTIHVDHDAIPPLACPCKSPLRESSQQEPPEKTTRGVSGTVLSCCELVLWGLLVDTNRHSALWTMYQIISVKSGRAISINRTGSIGHQSPCSRGYRMSGLRTIRNSRFVDFHNKRVSCIWGKLFGLNQQ